MTAPEGQQTPDTEAAQPGQRVQLRAATLADAEGVVALRRSLDEPKLTAADVREEWGIRSLDGRAWALVASASVAASAASDATDMANATPPVAPESVPTSEASGTSAPTATGPDVASVAQSDSAANGERIIGFAELVARAPGVFTPLVWVAATEQRHGLGGALLQQAEGEARALTAGPITLLAQITGQNEAGWRLLEGGGYRLSSTFQTMTLKMTEEPAAPAAIEGIEIRHFVVGSDERAVYEADEEAFQDERGKTPRTYDVWRNRLGMDGSRFDPSLWFVAWEGDQVAGTVMAEVTGGVGEIMHVGVRRPWRRRGLGEALTRQALVALYGKGVRYARLNVDGESQTNANKLYERMGFQVVTFYRNYLRELPGA